MAAVEAGVARPGRAAAGAGQAPSVAALHADGRLRRASRSRSSSAARAATSSTTTASATSTACPRCSASTPATGATSRPGGADQTKELGFFTNWTSAHPTSIELAARVAALAPGDLNRVFFTSGGSEAVDSALKLCPPVPQAHRQPGPHKVIRADRLPRHDDGRAVHHRHHRRARAVRAAVARRLPRPTTNLYRLRASADPAEAIRDRILFEGPETVAARLPRARAELRRLLRPAGELLPARARDLRRVRRPARLRRGHLLVGPARRVLRRRAHRLPARPHHHGEGPDLLLRADGRGDRLRPRRRAVRRRARRRSATASPSAGTRWPPPSR